MKTSATLLLLIIQAFLESRCEVTSPANQSGASSEPESVKLLYGESHGISWTDVSAKDRQKPILSRKYLDVYSVDYHYNHNLFFYTGWGAIWRLPMDEAKGDIQGDQIVGEAAGAAAMAVDWEHDLLYWTVPTNRTVWRCNLEGEVGSREIIIGDAGNLTKHNNLAVDPYMRFLFVATDAGYFLRTDLEGGDVTRVDHGLRLTSLALDIHNRRVYVSGYRAFDPILQSRLYDGGDVISYDMKHGTDWWVRLISIDVFSATPGQPTQLFWVHHPWKDRDSAWKVDLKDRQLFWSKEYTAGRSALVTETRIWCVKVYHPDVQTRPKYVEDTHELMSSSSQTLFATSAIKYISYLVLCCIKYQAFF